MLLQSLKAENFKNYEKVSLDFSWGVNCFIGRNGSGKTNLLDAIYYLCTGKSYFNAIDQQLIYMDELYFSVRGTYQRSGHEEDILCVLMKGKKKLIKRNDIPYDRMVEHYGEFPAVMVAPADIELITSGSEERRKWLDSTISLIDQEYLFHLMRYEKILQQRNAELRKLAADSHAQHSLLEVYDQMLVPLGEAIHQRRKDFIEEFLPYFQEYHVILSNGHEDVSLQYVSPLQSTAFEDLLKRSFRKDLVLQRTSAGVHKDDLEFLLFGQPLKRFGSQGQQKTFLLALKLAQFRFIRQVKGLTPLLLLDDVCERLDEERLHILFRLISNEEFGQVFVTDSSLPRLQQFLNDVDKECRFFVIENGTVIEELHGTEDFERE